MTSPPTPPPPLNPGGQAPQGRGVFSHLVPKNSPSTRIDSYLARHFSNLTRNQVQKLLRNKNIRVNERVIEPSYKVRVGDQIFIQIPPIEEIEAKPESIPLEILYEDESIAVINKPAELVVHAAAGHSSGTLVNALLYHLKDLSGIGGKFRPGIVHRLDKGTSGVMLVAKTNEAHHELVRQFQDRKIEKTYLALAYGRFKKEEGVFKNCLGRSRANRKKISSKTRRGKEAVTEYRVIRGGQGVITLLELKPKTGRTHQIRVHLAEAGHPIVGDPLYGGKQWIEKLEPDLKNLIQNLGRQVLHAWKIKFEHPITKNRMEFEAKIPEDMKKILETLL